MYQGVVNGELALLVVYVDDLLLCCQSETAREDCGESHWQDCTPKRDNGG